MGGYAGSGTDADAGAGTGVTGCWALLCGVLGGLEMVVVGEGGRSLLGSNLKEALLHIAWKGVFAIEQ